MCIGVSTHQKHYLLFFIKRPLQTAQAPSPPLYIGFSCPSTLKTGFFSEPFLAMTEKKKIVL